MSDGERERWNRRHADRGFFPLEPSRLLTPLAAYLPPAPGKFLDLAGGSGRHALWLAELGHDVTLVDISTVAIELASGEARRRGLTLRTVVGDLDERATLDRIAGPWDGILSFHFLAAPDQPAPAHAAPRTDSGPPSRPLLDWLTPRLDDDGRWIIVHPTLRNLQRHPRPRREHLLAEGELAAWARSADLEVLHAREGWLEEGRHESVLIARRIVRKRVSDERGVRAPMTVDPTPRTRGNS